MINISTRHFIDLERTRPDVFWLGEGGVVSMQITPAHFPLVSSARGASRPATSRPFPANPVASLTNHLPMRWRFLHFLLLGAHAAVWPLYLPTWFSLFPPPPCVYLKSMNATVCYLDLSVCVFAPLQQQAAAAATMMMMMMLLAASVSETRWCGGWKMN